MSAPKLIDVTPFEPLIIKVHYDGFDWNKLKPICEKMLADAPAMVDLEQNGASSSAIDRQARGVVYQCCNGMGYRARAIR